MTQTPDETAPKPATPATGQVTPPPETPKETGGPKGKDPTRYGDWESKGRCIDF